MPPDGMTGDAPDPGAGRQPAVVRAQSPAARPAAERWSRRLGVPLEEPGGRAGGPADGAPAGVSGAARQGAPPAVLEVGADGLAIRWRGGPPVRVVPAALVARRTGGRDLLLRAVGRVPAGAGVADATAGLGADAFRLAARDVAVTMIERAPLVAALLEDALDRARSGREGPPARRAAQRLTLVVGDARDVLPTLRPPPAVVVIDPMYPAAGKRGRPKKGMAVVRSLVGEDVDAAALLGVALEVATARVVVKRPRRAPPLGASEGFPPPTGSVVGTTSRYDIYAPRRRPT